MLRKFEVNFELLEKISTIVKAIISSKRFIAVEFAEMASIDKLF